MPSRWPDVGVKKRMWQEASITETSENPSARLWVDAYSADGKITLVNGRNTLDANAIGIGGDFFLFHPLKLITGSLGCLVCSTLMACSTGPSPS